MANAQADVTVNIKGNTGDLDAKLAKQEAAIKTLDGAINVLGGSVELAASAMVATGIASEESAESFEATALAAIAFADGSKRVIDGVKSLNEGLKSFGGVAGLAAKAQKAMNAAILANPYVAVAAGLAVLTLAVWAYVEATDEAAEAAENLARRQAAAAQANTTYANTEVRLAQARGAAQSEVLQLQLDAIKAREDEIAGLLDSNIETAEANKLLEEGRKLYQDTKVVKEQLKKATADEAEAARKAEEDKTNKQKEENAKRKTERDKDYADRLAAEQKFLDDVFKAQEELANKQKAAAEKRKADRQAIADFEHDMLMEEFNNEITMMKASRKATDDANKATTDSNEKRLKAQQDAFSSSLAVTAGFLKTIQGTIDKSTEEGFEKAKKYQIAEVRVSSIQAAFEAYKGLVGVPYVGQILAPAAAAAALLAGQNAINDIKSSKFQDSSAATNPIGGSGVAVPEGAGFGGAPNLGFGFGGRNFGQGVPVEAYVVAGTVTNAQQADAQIRRRRRLGG